MRVLRCIIFGHVQEALVVATTERDGLDTSLAEALKELEESAGKRSEVEAAVEAERATMREENETLRAEKEELGAKLSAQSHATTAAEEKALALEAQMEALQVGFTLLTAVCLINTSLVLLIHDCDVGT